METNFKLNDRVTKGGRVAGTVWKVTEKAVHVRYDDDTFEKFHFKPVHHTQSSVENLRHV